MAPRQLDYSLVFNERPFVTCYYLFNNHLRPIIIAVGIRIGADGEVYFGMLGTLIVRELNRW